jgi:hypothetical protein
MIKIFRNEKWKVLTFDEAILVKKSYKISNYGRILVYSDTDDENNETEEKLIKLSSINGYTTIPLKQKRNNKSTSRYVHKLVAEHFLEKGDGIYVIHLNYDKEDNRVVNLKWATKKEKEKHQFSNPAFINQPRRVRYSKLTENHVRLIKRKINDPNRKTRLKMIAKQFGISEMQLYRIKSGENWGHIQE